ncbi:MAG: protein kinase [Anaerolineae bacterium]|nr:protein kinase [Anaerolineae bacterium]
MTFQDGEVVGPYRVMHKLGHGGMATVFKAYHAALDRYVALKILHTAFMQDPNFLGRFEREAKVVAKLEHGNIIPIYDYADHNGSPFFVMKYVEGETLKARLNAGSLPQEEGMRVIQTVGAALTYAHQQGILHRDIKPSNVLIADDGHIFLTDFGLARIASAGESTLSSDMMLGTPQYISPEQAMGKRELDEGTDIYSFGVLVYELVVGEVPFTADTPYSIVHDHIYAPLPMPRAINPNVPEKIERVLLKALAKERDDRFASVDDFVKAFRASLKGEDLLDFWSSETLAAAAAPKAPAHSAVGGRATAPLEGGEPNGKDSKTRWRWWYLIPAVLGLFLCLIVFNNFRGLRRNQGAFPTDAPALGQVDIDQPGGIGTGDQDDEVADAGVAAALEAVAQNPRDPEAHLQLAAAYFDTGEESLAGDAYAAAEELAGENPEFYFLAAEIFRQRDLWVMTLEASLNAFGVLDGRPAGREVVSNLQQAAYHAAAVDGPRPEELLFSPEIDRTGLGDVPMVGIMAARARYMLRHGEMEQAERTLAQIFESTPELPVGLLVQAELLLAQGDVDEAQDILRSLVRDGAPNIDSWVRIEADRLLNQIYP